MHVVPPPGHRPPGRRPGGDGVERRRAGRGPRVTARRPPLVGGGAVASGDECSGRPGAAGPVRSLRRRARVVAAAPAPAPPVLAVNPGASTLKSTAGTVTPVTW